MRANNLHTVMGVKKSEDMVVDNPNPGALAKEADLAKDANVANDADKTMDPANPLDLVDYATELLRLQNLEKQLRRELDATDS